ncbi:hypothetical protein TNCV_4098601 [Trichonephila clavipes]|nr:hypothetical protein TNCV_4098601 [Trichonephila clavipes]
MVVSGATENIRDPPSQRIGRSHHNIGFAPPLPQNPVPCTLHNRWWNMKNEIIETIDVTWVNRLVTLPLLVTNLAKNTTSPSDHRKALGGVVRKSVGGNRSILPQSFELTSPSEEYGTFYEYRAGRYTPDLRTRRKKCTSSRINVSRKRQMHWTS